MPSAGGLLGVLLHGLGCAGGAPLPALSWRQTEQGLSHTLHRQNQRGLWAGFEAPAYLSFLHPGGELDVPRTPDQRLFEGEQGREGGAGGVDSLILCGASSTELQHLPDPETGLTLQPTWSFAPWRPSPWLTTATPGTSDPRHSLVPLQ